MAVPSSSFTVHNPGEGNGEEAPKNNYNVCQRTGFKMKPNSLATEWTQYKVRPESVDRRSQQDFVRVKAESLTGPIRAEQDDVFISTSTAPSDL